MQADSIRTVNIHKTAIVILLLLAALFAHAVPVQAQSEEQQAKDIARSCSFYASNNNKGYDKFWDGDTIYAFTVGGSGEQYLEVNLNGNAARGIYIKWALNPDAWSLETTLSDGSVVSADQGQYGFHQEYVELPENAVKFRMITDDGRSRPMEIVEMQILSPGELPDSVHIWQPAPSTAELMMIATHQDDEVLFFGGGIPYYAAELGYDTIIAYTAYANDLRINEALDGLWVCGVRQNPIFLGYPDKYCETLEGAKAYWSEKAVTRDLTELLVRYRPQVVISQDINGEYGHGQHKLTVHCLRKALKNAEDPDYLAGSLPEYQPWSVSKCYLHLYWNNVITMEWGNIALESAGGKTALEVAREAFKCHVSQLKLGYEVSVTDPKYDCRRFGLYWTKVGEDTAKNDFFENVELRYTDIEPTGYVPEWLLRTGRDGWHYRADNSGWHGSDYLRYCSVGGVEGWYQADVTGSLTEPITRTELVVDDNSIDLSAYSTLTLISESPRVFSYSNGIVVTDLPVRFCSVEDGQPGFYLADRNDGSLLEPREQVHVSASGINELKLPHLTLSSENSNDSPMNPAIIVMCCLLVVTAFVLSIEVMRLIAINKRRSKAARRGYSYNRNRR